MKFFRNKGRQRMSTHLHHSAFPLMRQKTKEEPDVLGCRVSKQLDVMWKQY